MPAFRNPAAPATLGSQAEPLSFFHHDSQTEGGMAEGAWLSQERVSAGGPRPFANSFASLSSINCLSAVGLTFRPPEPSFLSILSLCGIPRLFVSVSHSPVLRLSGFLLERGSGGHSSKSYGSERAAPLEESSLCPRNEKARELFSGINETTKNKRGGQQRPERRGPAKPSPQNRVRQ